MIHRRNWNGPRSVDGSVRPLGLVPLILSVWVFAGPAMGQVGIGRGLSCEDAAREQVDSGLERKIREVVADHAAALGGKDEAAASRAREELMSPLGCPTVSVEFRLKYAEVVEPALAPLVAGTDERVAANALLVCGRLKASIGLRPLEAGLANANPVIRFAAASGLRDMFSQLAADPSGFPEQQSERAMDRLAAALDSESDPMVADALILALGDGPQRNPVLRGKGIARLTSALGKNVASLRESAATLDPRWSGTLYRGLDLARLTILDQLVQGSADRSLTAQTAVLAGRTLALARDRFDASSEPERADLAAMVGAAEVAMVTAHNAQTGQKVGEQALQKVFEEAISSGEITPFQSALESWIGASGLLTKPPYSTKPDDFAPMN